jgi:hypothetical protein
MTLKVGQKNLEINILCMLLSMDLTLENGF